GGDAAHDRFEIVTIPMHIGRVRNETDLDDQATGFTEAEPVMLTTVISFPSTFAAENDARRVADRRREILCESFMNRLAKDLNAGSGQRSRVPVEFDRDVCCFRERY